MQEAAEVGNAGDSAEAKSLGKMEQKSYVKSGFLLPLVHHLKHSRKVIQIKRTDSDSPDFIELVKRLDADLAKRDGDEHSYYAQFNKINKIKYALVAYEDGIPLGCGAIKEYEPGTMEVKRMYVAPESRGKGIATKILVELENWASELQYDKCVLETGKRQPEAIQLYKKNRYKVIPNYGQYAEVENSVCFEKKLLRKQAI